MYYSSNMRRIFIAILNLLLFAVTSLYSASAPASEFVRSAVPIPCHSHNDYWRKVPVFSALHVGCVGIEADVWLIDDDLYVGHDRASLRPNRTFTSLYVEPLTRILEQRNDRNLSSYSALRGVYDMAPSQTLVLLVDLKTDAEDTWPLVMRQLEPLREKAWLSYVENGVVTLGPITVVGTGNSKFDMVVENGTYRDAFFDAPLDKLAGHQYDYRNSYYTSVSFKNSIGVVRYGGLSQAQLGKIRAQVAEAHSRDLKVRYWELPSWPISVRNLVWGILRKEGVDILNVDDLKGARVFLSINHTADG
jgi:hypothetical protein